MPREIVKHAGNYRWRSFNEARRRKHVVNGDAVEHVTMGNLCFFITRNYPAIFN